MASALKEVRMEGKRYKIIPTISASLVSAIKDGAVTKHIEKSEERREYISGEKIVCFPCVFC